MHIKRKMKLLFHETENIFMLRLLRRKKTLNFSMIRSCSSNNKSLRSSHTLNLHVHIQYFRCPDHAYWEEMWASVGKFHWTIRTTYYNYPVEWHTCSHALLTIQKYFWGVACKYSFICLDFSPHHHQMHMHCMCSVLIASIQLTVSFVRDHLFTCGV